jgi:RNA polymerase sigma-70 factor (ECF subfamily)
MAVTSHQDQPIGRKDDEVFRDIYPQMRRFAAVAAPAEVEPEDLLQEALVETLRRHHLVDLDYPAAYLRQVILSRASNHRRRRAPRWRAERLVAASRESNTDGYPSDLSELMWLSPRQRAVLYLSEVEGYKFDEIGQMVGCSAPAARMSATRARRRLRSVLMGEA